MRFKRRETSSPRALGTGRSNPESPRWPPIHDSRLPLRSRVTRIPSSAVVRAWKASTPYPYWTARRPTPSMRKGHSQSFPPFILLGFPRLTATCRDPARDSRRSAMTGPKDRPITRSIYVPKSASHMPLQTGALHRLAQHSPRALGSGSDRQKFSIARPPASQASRQRLSRLRLGAAARMIRVWSGEVEARPSFRPASNGVIEARDGPNVI
jgi:hypothetical protein